MTEIFPGKISDFGVYAHATPAVRTQAMQRLWRGLSAVPGCTHVKQWPNRTHVPRGLRRQANAHVRVRTHKPCRMGVGVEMQVLWCIPSSMVLREQWYAHVRVPHQSHKSGYHPVTLVGLAVPPPCRSYTTLFGLERGAGRDQWSSGNRPGTATREADTWKPSNSALM